MTIPIHIEEVRVVRGDTTHPSYSPQSNAEKVRAAILDDSEEFLRKGRNLIAEGLEMFSVVEVPQHRTLLTLIDQQIAQVVEHRRLRG